MQTVKADDRKRVTIPSAKAKQVFAIEQDADGTIRLIPVKAETKEPFPPGSLLKFITRESNKELAELAKGCVLGPVPG